MAALCRSRTSTGSTNGLPPTDTIPAGTAPPALPVLSGLCCVCHRQVGGAGRCLGSLREEWAGFHPLCAFVVPPMLCMRRALSTLSWTLTPAAAAAATDGTLGGSARRGKYGDDRKAAAAFAADRFPHLNVCARPSPFFACVLAHPRLTWLATGGGGGAREVGGSHCTSLDVWEMELHPAYCGQ